MDRAQASRRRLLDAAAAEFAAHGIAGARVDRISADAKVSKAQMYAYYGSKESLFDAVLADQVAAVLDAAPLTAEDLPGYAVRLYDAYLARPRLVRLATWARLERTPAGHLFGEAGELPKIRAISEAQEAGHINPALSPADVHSMVIALAMTWSPASITCTATAADPDADHQRRRTSLATAVRHAFAP
ncbi:MULTISPECIES: TetR family transcriptional regulator [unclassified Streptomyces]|uniref:TetR family transcriptional regulator n=1 Tax=Streptomyces johnsoniae TaxID=3075532 RepID=A0ABU2SH78_9ACTN|nr:MULTISPECIES: TetR family transcriptional regulator [unclassified Streptomyces]MDT0447224.1 TetR family transcriptional regulator [Streptomyces sp. DSM 41886]ONK10616.1 Nicotinate degradation protein S [Streptomyces sp. MP131-18]